MFSIHHIKLNAIEKLFCTVVDTSQNIWVRVVREEFSIIRENSGKIGKNSGKIRAKVEGKLGRSTELYSSVGRSKMKTED